MDEGQGKEGLDINMKFLSQEFRLNRYLVLP